MVEMRPEALDLDCFGSIGRHGAVRAHDPALAVALAELHVVVNVGEVLKLSGELESEIFLNAAWHKISAGGKLIKYAHHAAKASTP